MLATDKNTTYNHMNAIRSRLNPDSTTYQKWIKRRLKREKKLRKNSLLTQPKYTPPPKYTPSSNYYNIPHIPPPPYETYEDYCKRTNKIQNTN
tara:strand:+ start:588 stop:866 length:279 start_codon:yes stop_codon:yes gene_type:complete